MRLSFQPSLSKPIAKRFKAPINRALPSSRNEHRIKFELEVRKPQSKHWNITHTAGCEGAKRRDMLKGLLRKNRGAATIYWLWLSWSRTCSIGPELWSAYGEKLFWQAGKCDASFENLSYKVVENTPPARMVDRTLNELKLATNFIGYKRPAFPAKPR